jgi:hypothetical protein
VPPASELPHAVIEPLVLRAAKAVVAILRFIQLGVPLPPLKLTEQSQHGVIRVVEDSPLHPIKWAAKAFPVE